MSAERGAPPQILIFFTAATAAVTSTSRRSARFDLQHGDSVTDAVFAACIYSSSRVAGSTSEGGVLE